MKELMASPYFGVALSIVAFWSGVKLNHKLKTPVCNPLIVAIVLIVGVLLVFDIPYDTYNVGGALINMFLAPATACLAVAIYTKLDILKQYWLPILVGFVQEAIPVPPSSLSNALRTTSKRGEIICERSDICLFTPSRSLKYFT